MTASIEPCTADEFWSDDMTESPRMDPLGADLSASEAQEAHEGVGGAAGLSGGVLCDCAVHRREAERILANPPPVCRHENTAVVEEGPGFAGGFLIRVCDDCGNDVEVVR